MKISWLNWRVLIIDSRSLSAGAKYMGLYLNTFMNDRNDFAFPSISTICGEMSISNTTAIKHLKELEEDGWLVKHKRFGKSTIYYATIPSRVTDKIASNEESSLMENLHHSCEESSPTVMKNLHTNKQENKQSNKQSGVPFEEFWELYPRKADKKKAQTAWNRLSITKQKKAMEDIPSRFTKTEHKLIPYPTTYINGERWNDEMPQNCRKLTAAEEYKILFPRKAI